MNKKYEFKYDLLEDLVHYKPIYNTNNKQELLEHIKTLNRDEIIIKITLNDSYVFIIIYTKEAILRDGMETLLETCTKDINRVEIGLKEYQDKEEKEEEENE